MSGTEMVPKGTEVDLVVTRGLESDIEVTLVPKWICTEMDYPVVPNVTGSERDLTLDKSQNSAPNFLW